MTVRELLDAGRLSDAIRHSTDALRSNPGDLQSRTALFELLCVSGDLDRARKHLDLLGQESTEAVLAVQQYVHVLNAEAKRRRFFSAGVRPKLPFPSPYLDKQLDAIDYFRAGDNAKARELLEEAEELRPVASGSADGQKFDDFKDSNDLLGPCLEVHIEDEYSWIPWEAIQAISIPEPKQLRDLVWIPGVIELKSGSAGEAYIPVLYVDSYRDDNDAVKLGRVTQWRENVEEFAVGVGQKLFAAGDRDLGILEVRRLEFDHADTAGNS